MMTFGKRLANLRKIHYMRQVDLARRLGKSREAISKYEQNIRTPSIETLGQLAKLFNVTVDQLYFGGPDGSIEYRIGVDGETDVE